MDLRDYAELTLHGLIASNAPAIFKGIIIEFLRTPFQLLPPPHAKQNITVNSLVTMVEENKNLWAILPPEHYDKIQRVASQVGNVNWLTVEWLIEAIKKDHPAIASLFLGWKKGANWLGRQLEEIKKNVEAL